MSDESSTAKSAVRTGISFGTCLAIVISWYQYQSILLAIFHGILGRLYVGWYVLMGSYIQLAP